MLAPLFPNDSALDPARNAARDQKARLRNWKRSLKTGDDHEKVNGRIIEVVDIMKLFDYVDQLEKRLIYATKAHELTWHKGFASGYGEAARSGDELYDQLWELFAENKRDHKKRTT
jgi:hypothetical protein